MHAQFRRMWIRTALALAAASMLVTLRLWSTVRDRIDLPTLPSGPLVASADGLTLVRPGNRVSRARTSGPAPFTAAFERGLAAYNADDPDAAVDAFEEAVRLAPEHPEAHINLGLVYLRLRRADDGWRELHEGARLEQQHNQHAVDGGPGDATIKSRVLP